MILVTGASGFIGGKLAERLVNEGYKVICQYRREQVPDHLKKLEQRGAKLFRADLTDRSAYEQMFRYVDVLFHSAALASDWGPYEDFYMSNVKAVENLLKHSRKSGVRKTVLLSSISVHGFGPHDNSGEIGPYYEAVSHYQRSKLEMEKRAMQYNCDELAVSIIRPGNVYGPGDHTTMYPIFDAMEKGLMGYIDGGRSKTCPVYIDDLLDAILLAWNNDKANGEIFNITGGEDISWKELLDYSALNLGIKKPRLNMTGKAALFCGAFLERLFKILRSPVAPPLTKYRVSQLMHDYTFSMEKAAGILSYQPKVGFREGIGKTVNAYLDDKKKR